MKIYYSTSLANVEFFEKGVEIPPVGVLISYYEVQGKKQLEIASHSDSVFLDSGAFSAWTRGVPISLEEYIKFITSHEEKLDVYAALDDIVSGENSVNNYLKMREVGLHPLPTYHYGEPIEILNFYAEQTDYIALGGIAKVHKAPRIRWLDNLFEKYSDPSKIGFHGFGVQDRQILLRYPWRSVDASSAMMAAWNGNVYQPISHSCVDVKKMIGSERKKLKQWIYSLGVSFEDVVKRDMKGTYSRAKVNVLYYEDLARQVPTIFKRRSTPSLF